MTHSISIFVYDDDHQWHVAYGLYGKRGDIIIPVDQLDGFTDEQIGNAVRLATERADFCRALMRADQVGHGLSQFLSYYKENGELEEIIELFERYKDEDEGIADALEQVKRGPVRKKKVLNDHPNTRYTTPGFVYVLKSKHGYKLGKTKDMQTRISAFTLQLPFPVEVFHFIESDDYTAAEDYIHDYFADKHINGEWYELDEADLRWLLDIKSLNFMKKSEKRHATT